MRNMLSLRAAPLLAPFLALALATGCQPPDRGGMAAAAVDTAAVMAAVDSVRQAYQDAYNAGDAAAVAALYSQDAVFLPPDAPTTSGSTAIRAFLDEALAAGPQLQITPAATTVAGRDWVFEHGTTAVTVTPEGAAEPVEMSTSYLVILRRTAQGWKIVRVANTLDQAPPPPEE